VIVLKKFFETYYKKIENVDKAISKVMKGGIDFSFIVCIIALFTLLIHKNYYISHNLYDAAIMLFQAGLLFATQFFICGITIDTVKKSDSLR